MTKSKEPSFPFYSSDFLIGVTGMKDSDVGQYIKLLALQHQKGHLTGEEYKTFSPKMNPGVLKKFVLDENGKYYNSVLDIILQRRAVFKEKQIQNVTNRYTKTLPTTLPECYQDATNGATKTLPLEDEYINNIKEYRNIIPPSKTIVSLYCRIRNNGIDSNYFIEYYTARGWVYGKQKTAIVDWQAVIRTWEQHNKQNEPGKVNLKKLTDERKNHTI